VSVEKYLETKNAYLNELDFLEQLHINQDFGVHSRSGQYSAEPFRALATRANLEKADIRFFIIRDPYKRFSSFWHNRIMYGPDPYFGKIHAQLSSKYNLNESSDVQKAAIDFLNELARPLTKPITNGHLWPQIYLTKGKKYDFIIETDDLVNLPKTLATRSNYFRAFSDLEVPRLNISANSEYPLLWNHEEKAAFAKSYAADLLLYDDFKSGKCNAAENIELNLKCAFKQVNAYGHGLILVRNLLKKVLTNK
jgi:hypothetical protein